MIKFFRKIRRNLLSEGKTGKYFKYAIGEIVLVVIGILIALQINNWNENRKSDNILKNYYNQILKDLAKDYNLINEDSYVFQSNIALHKEFVENLPSFESPEAIIINSFKLNYTTAYVRFNANTIETLQSTGDIKLIPTEIRNKLIELKNSQDIAYKARSDNYDNFLKELSKATALGYNPNLLPLGGASKVPNQLFKDLNLENHYSDIALIVISSYFAKDLGERETLRQLNSILENVNSLFNIINEEMGTPYKDIERVFNEYKTFNLLISQGKTVDEIIAVIKAQDRKDPEYNISERYINVLGYYYLNTLKQKDDALKVFKLNIEMYPESWNTYDSYAECLLRMGDIEKGITFYKKSLELNPENANAVKVLSELKVEPKKL